MRKTTRSLAVAITAAALMSPLAFAQTEVQQPQAETPSAKPGNAQGMMGSMGGMMQGMQDGEMMPMMAQMHEMMETCTQMMQTHMDHEHEEN